MTPQDIITAIESTAASMRKKAAALDNFAAEKRAEMEANSAKPAPSDVNDILRNALIDIANSANASTVRGLQMRAANALQLAENAQKGTPKAADKAEPQKGTEDMPGVFALEIGPDSIRRFNGPIPDVVKDMIRKMSQGACECSSCRG